MGTRLRMLFLLPLVESLLGKVCRVWVTREPSSMNECLEKMERRLNTMLQIESVSGCLLPRPPLTTCVRGNIDKDK